MWKKLVIKWTLFLMLVFARCVTSSEFGVTLGDAAISQLIRHTASQFLEETRVADILLKSNEEPSFGSLAHLKLFNTVSYHNVSVQFRPKVVHIFFENLSLVSHANLSDVIWPIPFADSLVDSHVKVPRGHLRFIVDNQKVTLAKCALFNPDIAFQLRDSWLVNKGISAFGSMVSSFFEGAICSALSSSTSDLKHNAERKFPIYDFLPKKVQEHMAARNTTLFYRVNSIDADQNQLTVRAQIEWQKLIPAASDETSRLLGGHESDQNSTKLLDMEMRNGDLVTIWLEDAILNEILDQIDWNFEWMDEQIPVSSPIIPPDSREFLSTLCTECYFQVNVNAKGRPTIQATNSSLQLTKTDRIHLQVVNPDKKKQTVFVSLVLTIQAALRPSFDNGTLRTGVELIDTTITMEEGAFPKAWGFFMSDLIRGMIMDMMWPEIKSAIEDLTYGKGLKLSKYCGIDPNNAIIDIAEGSFSLSTRLVLPIFQSEACLKDLKSSIPNTSKLLQKTSNAQRRRRR
uniref:Lipid-binding serum glycoprotein C-terminal domain-containing protein n=1 Tax=Caenorhabditis japonica TaxID=281687 RepID=A0A8R1HN86_CAEJA